MQAEAIEKRLRKRFQTITMNELRGAIDRHTGSTPVLYFKITIRKEHSVETIESNRLETKPS